MTRIKAVTTTTSPTDGASPQGAEATDPRFEALKRDLQAAIVDLDQFKEENAAWLSTENLVEMGRIEVMLKAEYAAVDSAWVNGTGIGSAGGDGFERPQDLGPLWNGVPTESIFQDDADAAALGQDPELYGDYGGSIVVPNSGDPERPTKVAFQMTDDMVALYAASRGRDIVFTAVYLDGSRQSWVLKEGTMRSEPIVISALGLSHGVTIDASRVIRLNGGSPDTAGGFYIWGSEFDDAIMGTMSSDKIAGMAGKDRIYGMAGRDTIYGDEYYGKDGKAGDFVKGYGSDDYIDGGAGSDIIYGGDKSDTVVSDRADAIFEEEARAAGESAALPDPSFLTLSPDWELSDDPEEGTMVLQNLTGNGGTIDIEMPAGYTMAYAEKDPDGLSLVITFVGDEGTFKLRIEKFFSESFGDTPEEAIVRLNFIGTEGSDIIDFSRIEGLTSQVINLSGGEGDDVILGARTTLLGEGVDVDDLTRSQGNSNGVLTALVENDGVFAIPEDYEDEDGEISTYGGYAAAVDSTANVISITRDPNATEQDPTLSLLVPEGYERAYAAQGGGFMYLVFVNPSSTGGAADTIVFRIASDLNLDLTHINAEYRTASGGGTGFDSHQIEIIPISLDDVDYSLDGGAGNDLVFTQRGGRVQGGGSGDEVVEMESPSRPRPPRQSSETGGGDGGNEGGSGTGGTGNTDGANS